MIVEVYDALKEAGASEEKAKAAAGAIADYSSRFDRIESEIKALRVESETGLKTFKIEFESEIKIIKAELSVIKWMLGFVIAGTISILIKALL